MMLAENMYGDNLRLLDEYGVHSKIADFIVGPPVDEEGFKYQPLALTVPFTRAIQLAAKVTVFDVDSDAPVITFLVTKVSMYFQREQFLKIEGRNVIALPAEV